MNTKLGNVGGVLLRWLAHVWVVGVFLLWGAFFLEHTQEWFITPFPNHPPLKICLAHGLHLLMLLGLLASLRWPRVGAVWVAVTAFLFFFDKTGSHFPVFFGGTVAPVLLLMLCAWLGRETRRGATGQVSRPPANLRA